MLVLERHGAVYCRAELIVEGADNALPLLVALGYVIELLLHLSGKVVVHYVGEILNQEIVDHHTYVGGNKL